MTVSWNFSTLTFGSGNFRWGNNLEQFGENDLGAVEKSNIDFDIDT
jgi:hypothetical protein